MLLKPPPDPNCMYGDFKIVLDPDCVKAGSAFEIIIKNSKQICLEKIYMSIEIRFN